MPTATRPALVGRDESLATLREALESAAAGAPRVVVVSGETGVGKTRLVRELLRRERPIALAGACVPVAGEALPFAPLTQALRQLSRTARGQHALGRSPELSRLLTERPVDEEPADGGFQQLRLFQSVLDLLRRVGDERPAVHVVDDVNWADRSTLDLLRFLGTNLTDERALVVITYRSDELTDDSPLRTWLAELARLPRTVRIQLERLAPGDTATLASAWAGGSPDPALLESIVTRSAGNPLYVEHLVRHGQADLPDTLHDLLRSRVSALPPDTRRMLRALAVFGRGVPLELLAATLGLPEDEVEEHVRVALETGVVTFSSDDSLRFRHPALREVVASQLLPSERRRLHRAAAETLSAAGPHAATSGELARHWHEAGDLERALESALAAGAAAEAMYAFADAHANYLRAVELLDRVPREVDRVACLRSAARAAGLLGDDAEAVRLLEQALQLTEEPGVRADLLTRLGNLHLLAGRLPSADTALREARALTSGGDPSLAAARALSALALLAASWPMVEEAEQVGAEALVLSEQVGARREAGHAHNALGLAAAQRGDLTAAVDQLRRALILAQEAGDAEGQQFAYINLSHVLGLVGEYDEQVAVCREGIATLTDMGLVRQTGNVLMANAGEALLHMGRLDEADEMLRRGLSLHTRGIMAAPVLMRAGQLAMVRGDQERAWDLVEQARLIVESEEAPLSWQREVAQVAAEIELWAKRPVAAFGVVERTLELISGTDEHPQCRALVALGLRALGDLADAHRDAASVVDRRERLEALLALAHCHPDDDVPDDPVEAGLALTARAELLRADGASDPAAWTAAGEAWAAARRPVPTAYAAWREAEARLGAGVDAEAISVLRRAHERAVGLGAQALVAEIEMLATWYRVDLVPAASEEAGDPLDVYGLTSREREVLEGLADGRTNSEIAEALFISVKTASVHVSNILRKLDVSGRQEAARIAHRHGLGRAGTGPRPT